MKVAVVTAYWRDDAAYFDRCIASVRDQDAKVTHIVVADGCELPHTKTDTAGVRIIHLPHNYHDSGNTPRLHGCNAAMQEGFDAIAFLDADCWYHPRHISSLLESHSVTGALVGASQRMICGLDGSPVGICLLSGTPQFADTSCMIWFGEAMRHGLHWGAIPYEFHTIGDRIVWKQISDQRVSRCFTSRPTVGYTAKHERFYERVGLPVPHGTRKHTGTGVAVRKYRDQYGVDLSISWALAAWSQLSAEQRASWTIGAE